MKKQVFAVLKKNEASTKTVSPAKNKPQITPYMKPEEMKEYDNEKDDLPEMSIFLLLFTLQIVLPMENEEKNTDQQFFKLRAHKYTNALDKINEKYFLIIEQ